MKKIFKILSFLLFVVFTYNSANAIEVVTSSNKTNSCAGANVNAIYYITGSSYDRFLGDMFSTPDDRLISNNKSKVTIWSSDNSLLSGCTNSSDWSRISSLSPGSNTNVLALGANCTFNKPTNSNNRTLQFVYNVGYYDIYSGNGQYVGDWDLVYFLNTTEANNNTPHTVPYTNVGFDNLNIHNNECFNVELRYCGDGIVSNGEVCDDGNNLDGDSCNSTCTVATGPICGNGIIEAPETCDDGNTIDGDGCSSTCQLPVSPGTCEAGVTGVQTSPISSTTPNLCLNSGETVVLFESTTSGLTTTYSWGCSDGVVIHTEGSCSASYTGILPPSSSSSGGGSSSSSSGGGSSSSSGGGVGNYCGDGHVQRPNDNLEMEECDFGSETDWAFCNADCTYSNLTIPGACDPAVESCNITIPNGGSIDFGPSDSVIIGAGMNPYIAHSLGKPYIQNNSDYDLYFDQICVVDRDGTTLIGSTVCENMGDVLRSGEIKYFSTIPNFVGAVVTTGNYADNTLVTTVKHDGIRYDNAYFVAELDVRVAQSSVATTGGGTSYLSSTNSVGNISDISNNGTLDPTKNKNFVGAGVSGGDISSYSKEIDDSTSVSTIASEGTTYEEGINNITDTSGTALGDTSSLSDFENYNGIDNVFILKNKNFVVNNDFLAGLSGARTYIIENGDLRINTDINYSDNIAFVVKGGNITIHKDVNVIDGTYITIEKDSIGGDFIGVGGSTTNRLLVNGSLYGNIDRLISTRTYVKQNSFNQIDVGTVVSFGSSLFRKTAPLLSTFINEYLESEKVAK